MQAQATSRIRIGFNVAVTPYLHPYVWAKDLASLDAATGGRVIAGFGLGCGPPTRQDVVSRRLIHDRGEVLTTGLERRLFRC